MRRDQYKDREHWALRPKRGLLAPAYRVELLQLLQRGRAMNVRVRHVDGEFEGLEEIVKGPSLAFPWREWKRIQRDEKRQAELAESAANRPHIDKVVVEAADLVLTASGESGVVPWRDYPGYVCVDRDALERIADRAGTENRDWRLRPAFVDSGDTLWCYRESIVRLAIALAKAEPDMVELYLEKEEAELVARGYSESRFYHGYLLEQRPAFVLARSWAGTTTDRDLLRLENERLRQLLWRSISGLRKAGAHDEANRIERKFQAFD